MVEIWLHRCKVLSFVVVASLALIGAAAGAASACPGDDDSPKSYWCPGDDDSPKGYWCPGDDDSPKSYCPGDDDSPKS